jgi:hypothetical protein
MDAEDLITIKITLKARSALLDLLPLMARERGLARMTLIDAASLAILEALARREQADAAREKEKKA